MVDEYEMVKFSQIAILYKKIMKKKNRVVVMVLIQWSNLFKEDATSKDLKEVDNQFPNFCIDF